MPAHLVEIAYPAGPAQAPRLIEPERLGRQRAQSEINRLAFRGQVIPPHDGCAGFVVDVDVCARHTPMIHQQVSPKQQPVVNAVSSAVILRICDAPGDVLSPGWARSGREAGAATIDLQWTVGSIPRCASPRASGGRPTARELYMTRLDPISPYLACPRGVHRPTTVNWSGWVTEVSPVRRLRLPCCR